jgi:hypothetical protein
MGQMSTPGEYLYRVLCERGIVRKTVLALHEKADYELTAALFIQSAADCANTHSENTGLPCTFCGHVMKYMQIDTDHDNGKLLVRINAGWTKAEALKQSKGLASLIKQFAESL